MNPRCPSCGELQSSAQAAACEACGHTFHRTQSRTPTFKPAARPKKIQVCVDLALTVDRTASSAQFAAGIPMTAELILDQMSAKAREMRVWVQSHGDLDEGQEPLLLTDAGQPAQAVSDLRTIDYSGGGVPEEHHLDAIANLLDVVPWTADPSKARGAILAFMTAESKPLRSGQSPAELGRSIAERGILLYLVCQSSARLDELCDAAGGMQFEISNAPDADELQQIASQLAASLVATVGQGKTVPVQALSL